MNTADRSLTQLDFALRRRFEFVEMLPKSILLSGVKIHDVDIGELLDTINERIECLLDRDHLIGHADFLPLTKVVLSEREKELAKIFKNKLLPLLQEYFFEDWENIRMVLGKSADKVIKTKDAKDGFPEKLFLSNELDIVLSDKADVFYSDILQPYNKL